MDANATRLPEWNDRTWIYLGLAPAIGATITATAALVTAVATVALVAIVGALVLILRPILTKAGAVATVVFAAVSLMVIAGELLASSASDVHASAGVFFVLTAVNVLVLRQALLVDRDRPAADYGATLRSASIAALLIVAIGVVRELLSAGSLFGVELGDFGVGAFGGPGIALMLAGLIVALFNRLTAGGASS